MKILYIEDDTNLRRTMKRVLLRIFDKPQIDEVEYAEAAINLIRDATLDKPYDLVISDFNLLGAGTGGDVFAWVQEHASYLEPRFLFFTSDRQASRLHKHYIEKPIDPDDFVRAVKALFI